MATGAIRGCHFTAFDAGLTAGMAGLALAIVIGRHGVDFLMWIVAACALDARIFHVEAAAIGQAIRLKANVPDVMGTIHGNLFPSAMALPAKLIGFFGG